MIKVNYLKQCAVCGTQVQSNIILKWKRESDGIVFHVCALCGEGGLANKDSVIEYKGLTHTTTYEGKIKGTFEQWMALKKVTVTNMKLTPKGNYRIEIAEDNKLWFPMKSTPMSDMMFIDFNAGKTVTVTIDEGK